MHFIYIHICVKHFGVANIKKTGEPVLTFFILVLILALTVLGITPKQ